MNLATVLMCWNIPHIPEELIYELFCNAGPIEDISFGKNGKSCFIVYEHEEAVITAKDIFSDVKLNGRPIRMFDHEEIVKIYSTQEEQVTQNINNEYNDNHPHNFKSRPYEGPTFSRDNRTYSSGFNRNPPDYRNYERFNGPNRHSLMNGSANSQHLRESENDFANDSRPSSSMRNSMTNCSYRNRPDLLPTSNQPSKKHKFDSSSSIHNLMNDSSDIFETLMNPYNTPISRNPRDTSGRDFSERFKYDHRIYDNDVPAGLSMNEFMKEKWGAETKLDRKNTDAHHWNRSFHSEDGKPDSLDFYKSKTKDIDQTRSYENLSRRGDDQRNERNNYHSGQNRDHPPRMRHPDREMYHVRSPKLHDLPPVGAAYKSRNPYHGKHDHRYRGQHNNRSKRH